MYTKGEWFLNCQGQIRSKELSKKGYQDYICQMPFSNNRECDEMPEAEANAQLISASPDLLEACKMLMKQIYFAEYDNSYQCDKNIDIALNVCKRAIKKAEEKL